MMSESLLQRRLFDVFTRQALFIEQVRVNEALLFNDVLADIEKDFRLNLSKIKYENLSELSKAQIQRFIKVLRSSQTVIYSKYQRQILARLQKFTEAVVNQSLQIGGSYLSAVQKDEEELIPVGLVRSRNLIEAETKSNGFSSLSGLAVLIAGGGMLAKFWPVVRNSVMPTGGTKPVDYLNTAIAASMMRVSQAVMAAWVNGMSVQELSAQVLGSKSTGEGNPNLPGGTKSAEVTKIRNTMNAVTATLIQHVAQISNSSTNSLIWRGYDWLSVMDSRTSAVCRHLNKKRFRYGKGPLPPAHPNCRSHTVPAVGEASTFTPPSMIDWLLRQNRGFIVGTFSNTIAQSLAEGNRPPGDVNVVNSVKPITIEQFANRTGDLFDTGEAGQ